MSIEADEDTPRRSYMDYIDSMPLDPDPEVFGMHTNANITCNLNETMGTCSTLLALQPRTMEAGGKTRDEIVSDMALSIYERMPERFDVEAISMRYPVRYEESMNTVLGQECIRYNRIIDVMRKSLSDFQKALKGIVVMSADLDSMGDAFATQRVPTMWEAQAYPSLKPLAAWVEELIMRLHFIADWVTNGSPATYWVSGFYFPQAFLTGTLQNYARQKQLPIDTLSFAFHVLNVDQSTLEKPESGCYIYGLYLEGAKWDPQTASLNDSTPKQLYTELPVMRLLPIQDRVAPSENVYRCPVYKGETVVGEPTPAVSMKVHTPLFCLIVLLISVLSRRGQLSTTGHSTNFVMWIELPSGRETIINDIGLYDCGTWVKAGVAAVCSLKY